MSDLGAKSGEKDAEAGDMGRQMAPVLAALGHGLGNDLVAIVLFGSRARGEAEADSDWDLLVIARHLPPRAFQRHLYLKQMLPAECRGRVAILAKTPEEFESYLTGLFLDVALDGIILYDSQGYMADRLARLRRLIQEQGLQRRQMGRDLVWDWQRFPGLGWSLDWEMAR
ncbi:MAG: nucleotidyltransferase domain-containing protein [Chloroflexia bacterium]